MSKLKTYHPYSDGYFSFTANDIKILGVGMRASDGLVIYYLEDGYTSKTVNGFIAKADEDVSDCNLQFIGAIDGRCVFIQKDSQTMPIVEQEVVNEILFQIEQRIPNGSAYNFVEQLRHQLYNEDVWVQRIIDRLQTEDLRKTQDALTKAQSEMVQAMKQLETELRQKMTVLSQIEFLSKELGYQKEFVDKHPF